MDGDDLASEPSENTEHRSLAEIFTEAFPYYLAMGMTYDEFWRESPSLVRAYRKAFEIRRANKNWELWQQGVYIYQALRCAPLAVGFAKDAKPERYPDRPLPLTEKEAKEQEEQRERENFFAYLKLMEAESERNRKKLETMQKQEVSENGGD